MSDDKRRGRNERDATRKWPRPERQGGHRTGGPFAGPRRTLSVPRSGARLRGARAEAEALGRWLEINPRAEWRQFTHGFHAYPARMHPHIARRALADLAGPETRVLDPFCGSGTTLVESLLRGCRGIGMDIHPLAVRLTRLKCSLWSPEMLEKLAAVGAIISETAWDAARSRARALNAPLRDPREPQWFAPHVRYEIANLHGEIGALEDSRVADALEMVLSSVLVKVSNFESDSSQRLIVRHLPRGFTSQLFGRRTQELVSQLAELAAAAPPGARSPRVLEGDARQLKGVGDAVADVAITSPPYLGTYNYSAHQSLRVAMLGLDDSGAERLEIGSRKEAEADPSRSFAIWRWDVVRALTAMARVLKPSGVAIVMVGTSNVAGRTVHSDKLIDEVADQAGFEVLAMASQDRPDFTPRAPGRREQPLPEHLIWLQRIPQKIPSR